MQIVKTTQLEPGMITAVPVKTKRGQLIVNEGMELTSQLIARISFYGIDCVRIDAPDLVEPKKEEEPNIKESTPSKSLAPRGNVQEPTYSQRIKKSPAFQRFQYDYSLSTSNLMNDFQSILGDNGLNTKSLFDATAPLLSETKTSIELFDMLHNMRAVDDSIYAHSMNVSLIAGVFGKWLSLPKEDLDILIMAALLHDIGKAKIPPQILNKPGKYTDEEFALVKQHPQFGYDVLNGIQGLDPRIKKSALMHHERCDGTGYPNHLTAKDLDDFSQIIAIADVYDAMTAARSYRSPLCPFQVIAAFENEGLQKYNPKYILTFLEHIATTYQNNRVLLSDGRGANIVLLNKNALSKPMVQVSDGTCIDLSHTSGLSIQSLL